MAVRPMNLLKSRLGYAIGKQKQGRAEGDAATAIVSTRLVLAGIFGFRGRQEKSSLHRFAMAAITQEMPIGCKGAAVNLGLARM